MIISRSHEFIFVWIDRTGGHSIEAALKPFGATRYRPKGPVANKALIKHVPARRLATCPEFAENWDKYFKFSFVRNPWDHMVSWYFFRKARYSGSFRDFLLKKEGSSD